MHALRPGRVLATALGLLVSPAVIAIRRPARIGSSLRPVELGQPRVALLVNLGGGVTGALAAALAIVVPAVTMLPPGPPLEVE